MLGDFNVLTVVNVKLFLGGAPTLPLAEQECLCLAQPTHGTCAPGLLAKMAKRLARAVGLPFGSPETERRSPVCVQPDSPSGPQQPSAGVSCGTWQRAPRPNRLAFKLLQGHSREP
ncbi:hypothetical protein GUJ93_ZPchr0002g24204 [Zizania palustris]|uniref:Uncharacterized protein n=1 Tax=Zizania palustris TaxID=103762 RepID=A0A8J5VWN7_ZIZPA|nr:hypothetical protein GUJ93_ZPchr0002g24204 [Zizania palustris]